MKISRIYLFPILIALSVISLQSCKTKKIAPAPPAAVPAKEVPEEKPEPAPVQQAQAAPAPVVEKPNFDFGNIQFEFNSVVLKTNSYQLLEQISREIKKDPTARFILNGHSSEEGSSVHNMALSVDRANAVKTYLANAGVDAENLTIKGYGETKPIATNSTEEGRSLNRRVEFKLNN